MKLQGPVREGSGALKNYWGGCLERCPAVKSFGCSSRESRFGSQHPQLSLTLASMYLMPSSGFSGYCTHIVLRHKTPKHI